jgi:hypothetical protein
LLQWIIFSGGLDLDARDMREGRSLTIHKVWIVQMRWVEILERETGIEPATNGLGSRYSTIELLPLRGQL